MALSGTTRVESFPFDSRADGYDSDGYPVYDRAVGAATLRMAFSKFFTGGVFGTPANALQIGRASSGLAVTVQPGAFIIDGAIGVVGSGDDPVTLTIDSAAPQGNTAYAIMLTLDDNEQSRSLYLRVVKGSAAASPQPPEPDRTTPGVYEYRLGYVTVASGQTDMTSAEVHNEKGSDVCPYANPFNEVDLSEVVSDARDSAQIALDTYLELVQSYYDLVESALDGTTANYLQQQINELRESLGVDLSEEVDGSTIEYTQESLEAKKYLRVKDGGISLDKLNNGISHRLLPSADGQSGQLLTSTGTGAEWKYLYDREAVTLWTGMWAEGPLTVANISKYSALIIEAGNYHTTFPCIRAGEYVSGSGTMFASSSNGSYIYVFNAKLSGDTLSPFATTSEASCCSELRQRSGYPPEWTNGAVTAIKGVIQ